MSQTPNAMPELSRFEQPYDWETIDATVHEVGGVVLRRLFSSAEVERFNREIDAYLMQHQAAGLPSSGSSDYDTFLGHRTVRLHGLLEKFASAADWLCRDELVDWAERLLDPVATSVLLNAAELIQIGPGEPGQHLHRDTDSWPLAPLGEHPLMVNALVALDPFTLENGATRVVPESWRWERDRRATEQEMLRSTMDAGDALVFRGDIVHGGGANATERPRRAISLSYCAGWLRPVENGILNVSRDRAKSLPKRLQAMLGYAAYDGSRDNGGLVGLYENGDPAVLLEG